MLLHCWKKTPSVLGFKFVVPSVLQLKQTKNNQTILKQNKV